MGSRAFPRRALIGFASAVAIAAAVLVGARQLFGVSSWTGLGGAGPARATEANAAPEDTSPGGADTDTVKLSPTQLQSINVQAVPQRRFPLEDEAIGSIDFNEDMSAQVFAPYQGRIVALYAKVGDDVAKGQLLFTIDSPDLIQAESTLIQAAGVLRLTTRTLERTKTLLTANGAAQKDLDQAISDQQTADGNLEAAKDAVRIFGKTPADIDKIIATRRVDPVLEVHSPIGGKVTARAGAPGLFVQPGNAPAPFSVADISTMWMLANVPEESVARYAIGQPVSVRVPAYPDKVFTGRITTIGATVDPNTRRTFLRSEIADPEHCLRSGMFANFRIETGRPVDSLALPVDGVVREGDGTMTAFVTTDGKSFTRRSVTLGMLRDGYFQVLEGLKPNELVVTTGALFLSNALNGVSID